MSLPNVPAPINSISLGKAKSQVFCCPFGFRLTTFCMMAKMETGGRAGRVEGQIESGNMSL